MEINVKELLENYQQNKSAMMLCENKGLAFPPTVVAFKSLCDCIDVLEPTLQAIILAIYVEKWSIRKTAEKLHYGNRTIFRKRDIAIEAIEKLMAVGR